MYKCFVSCTNGLRWNYYCYFIIMFPQRHQAIFVNASQTAWRQRRRGNQPRNVTQLHAGIGVWLSVHLMIDRRASQLLSWDLLGRREILTGLWVRTVHWGRKAWEG